MSNPNRLLFIILNLGVISFALQGCMQKVTREAVKSTAAKPVKKEAHCQPLSLPQDLRFLAPLYRCPKILSPSTQTLTVSDLSEVVQQTIIGCCWRQYLGLDEQLWGQNGKPGDKIALLKAIAYSLSYLQSQGAATTYQSYVIPEITRDRIIHSLKRFQQLVLKSRSPQELQAAVQREFMLYQAVGRDGSGNVLFTAYYEPIYVASRVPTPEYRYPLYKRPPNLAAWSKPHPTRLELEGADGLQGAKGKLKGLELFWLRDRLEAYMIHIQGSAKLQLTDGKQTTVGYAGNTAYNYTSIGRELANDGKMPLEGMTMPKIINYFQKYPQELDNYLPRDRSFVFFQENYGHPATGSISVPLTAERSIATDKSLMPPGALALLHAPMPYINAQGQIEYRLVSRYVLDQDTGGAIKGAGRVDYFLGSGKAAGDRAGVTVSNGQMFYLLLKPTPTVP